ncbi:MAG: hypothetical protein PQJ58_01180 [Spirochaetales bacterium]|nr:hypothetical protein [Spirochaetales bacterium]
MHPKNILFILIITLLALASCKTTDSGTDTPSETEAPSPVPAEETAAGNEQNPESEENPETVENSLIEDTALSENRSEPGKDTGESSEEPVTVKTLSSGGGIKNRPAPVLPEEKRDEVPEPKSEIDEKEILEKEDPTAVPEFSETIETAETLTADRADQSEILKESTDSESDPSFPKAPVVSILPDENNLSESLPAETKETARTETDPVTDNRELESDLPSEKEDFPSNPLLPLVIRSEENKADSLPVEEQPVSETPVQKETVSPVTPAAAEPAPETAELTAGMDGQAAAEPELQEEQFIPSDKYSAAADSTGKLIIFLEGSGWVFLSSRGENNLKLSDKSYEPESGRTRFAFRPENENQYDAELVFMKQDLLRGETEQKILRIDDFNPGSQSTITERPAGTDSLSGLDDLSSSAGSEDSNMTSAADRTDAIPETDLSDGLDTIPEPAAAAISEEPVPAAEGEDTELTNKPVLPENLDELGPAELMELAEGYEKPGEGQSLETALKLYEKIRMDYPVTEERFEAEQRIRYLNKHYFKVQ